MNGISGRPIVCWDSCIFLAWFKQEKDKPLEEIEVILKQVSDGKIALLVSAISCAEVLNDTVGSRAGEQFQSFVKRNNVIAANVDFRIAKIAATIREKTIAACKVGEIEKSVRAPDALIVATATCYRATSLHTFDPILLSLSGTEAVEGLSITKPTTDEEYDLF